jgi:hypothetical protein
VTVTEGNRGMSATAEGIRPSRPSPIVRAPLLRLLVPLLTVGLLLVGLVGSPSAIGRAVQGGSPATTDAAQVGFEFDGRFFAGGTAVSREWILASRHQIDDYPVPESDYRVRGLGG